MELENRPPDIDDADDVILYAELILDELQEAKQDDGVISLVEIVEVMASTAPEGLEAVVGSSTIPDELALASDEQKAALVDKAFPVLQKLVHLFIK